MVPTYHMNIIIADELNSRRAVTDNLARCGALSCYVLLLCTVYAGFPPPGFPRHQGPFFSWYSINSISNDSRPVFQKYYTSTLLICTTLVLPLKCLFTFNFVGDFFCSDVFSNSEIVTCQWGGRSTFRNTMIQSTDLNRSRNSPQVMFFRFETKMTKRQKTDPRTRGKNRKFNRKRYTPDHTLDNRQWPLQ